MQAGLIDCFGLIATNAESAGGLPASSAGQIADRIGAAGLVDADKQTNGADTLALYRRST
ncbi:MAG: hypothetical protein MO852_04540 [Candidatus Devosia euplotis]|nr:hypothetical protein [Candidatus Devosia euplotis]